MTAILPINPKTEFQKRADVFLSKARAFLDSYLFYIFEAFAALLFVATKNEVGGAVVFACLISLMLLICDDVLPTTLPFLLVSTFTTNCYDSFDTFIGYAIYAPVVLACLVFHFVVYKKPYSLGESVNGICAVSIAILVGGIGRYALKDYFLSAYYVFGLSFGMALAYFLMRSQFFADKRKNFKRRFSVVMTIEGLVCLGMILIGYGRYYLGIGNGIGFSRNNISTMLMFSMPFPLYLSTKRKFYALFTPVLYAAICVTTSRGGLLFGSVEFLVCCSYWIFAERRRKPRVIRFIICLVVALLVMVVCGKVILDVIFDRFVASGAITGDARYRMIMESIRNFLKNPFSGTGILDDGIFYGEFRKKGTMAWYHMMIPQIIGSMGLIGVAAYSYQLFGRAKLVFTKTDYWSLCLGISYLGVLLMSQVNPGEFCPVPFELVAVLLFILQEKRLEEPKLKRLY